MDSKFPNYAAKEGADNLERRVKSATSPSRRDRWRSWGRSAEYNIKRMWNSNRPVPFRRDLEGWRTCRRLNTDRMEKIASGDVDAWKSRRTISARRLQEMALPRIEPGRLWRAVAHEEAARIEKRPERDRVRSDESSSWSYAAKRCAEQINYQIQDEHEREPWSLAIKWNSRMRLRTEDSWWRRLKELARRIGTE